MQMIFLLEYQEVPPEDTHPNYLNQGLTQHFFSLRVINIWNNLPQDVVSAKSTSTFKIKLDKYWNTIGYGHNQGHWPINNLLSIN